jgi:hypothetical protein
MILRVSPDPVNRGSDAITLRAQRKMRHPSVRQLVLGDSSLQCDRTLPVQIHKIRAADDSVCPGLPLTILLYFR